MQKDDIFANYKSLYELTSKTADNHIAFYRNKETQSINDLFDIWKKLSDQAENFDKHDWTQNWHNWNKNFQAFQGHKYEAKFLIQWYLTEVLEELIKKLMKYYGDSIASIQENKKHQKNTSDDISELIKQEVKRQIKLELSKQKKKSE